MGAAEHISLCADPGALNFSVRRVLDPLVGRIDREGLYPADALREFGALGAFRHHLASQRPDAQCDIAAAIDAIGAIGRSCGSTAFMAWCQDACSWYVEQGRSETLRQTLLPGLASAQVLAGTGMSNPMKSFASIEQLALHGQQVDGGFIVNGRLPWVSNLGVGHVFGTAFRIDPSHHGSGRELMALIRCDWPGLTMSEVPSFLAMDGTGNYGLEFVDVFVPDEYILADPIGPWLKRIRNGFVLMQVGIGTGIIEGCIELMRESNLRLAHVNGFLEDGPDELEDELCALRERTGQLAQGALDDSDSQFAQVLTARLMASELTLRATQSAMLHAGAAGYALASPVQRRLREGYFVAIVTPAIKHLRKEIDRLMRSGAR